MAEHGIKFGKPKVDLDALRVLEGVGRRQAHRRAGRPRQAAQGRGGHRRRVADRAEHASSSAIGRSRSTTASSPRGRRRRRCPRFPTTTRIFYSTGALELPSVPKRLLVIGCGIIGLEMATVYDALGSKVTMVELLDQLIPGCDPDLVKPLHKRISARYEAIHLGTKVESVEASEEHLRGEALDRRVARSSTGSWWRSGAGRTGARSAPPRPGVTVDDARVHPGRPPAAHERAGDLRDRRRRRRPDARPQGLARGQGRRRGDRRRSRRRVRPPDDPVGRLHRPRGGVDGADRDRGPASRGSSTKRRRSPGPPPAARCRWAATRA